MASDRLRLYVALKTVTEILERVHHTDLGLKRATQDQLYAEADDAVLEIKKTWKEDGDIAQDL